MEELPIEVGETKVSFPWFAGTPTPEEVKAYDHFICALCEMARNQKRVTAKERDTGNNKYAFRCFLLRLGFIGPEYKQGAQDPPAEPDRQLRFQGGTPEGGGGRCGFRVKKHWRFSAPATLRERAWSLSAWTIPRPLRLGRRVRCWVWTMWESILVAWDNGSGLNVAFGEDIQAAARSRYKAL